MGEEIYINSNSKELVILDPGHGEDTPGKRKDWGEYIFYEWLNNRSIVKAIMYEFNHRKLNYALLVPERYDIPLKDRIVRTASIKKRFPGYKQFLISIHSNAFKDESVTGFEIYTSPGQNKSDDIATVFYNNAKHLGMKMRSGIGDGDPDKEANFTILTGSSVWAILLELGFYTNKYEADLISSTWFHRAIANYIANTTEEIFNKNII